MRSTHLLILGLAAAMCLAQAVGCAGARDWLPVSPAAAAVTAPIAEVATDPETVARPAVHVVEHDRYSVTTAAAVALQAPANTNPEISLAQPSPAVIEEIPRVPGDVTDFSVPIDLSTALELAAGQNPQVLFAQQRIREAAAQLRQADALWLPSLRAGVNYNKHEGRLQDVEGNITDVSRGSLYSGFGAQAVGASSPAVPGLIVRFHASDAIFQPRIAERTLAARRQASQTVTQDLLTETAIAYMNLLEAIQVRAIARETADHLQELADLTASFANSGAGLRADADRVRTELLLQRVEVARAEENVQVAAVRLTQLLGQDPTLRLEPQETVLVPLNVAPEEMPINDLVATGLSNRPELAESRFLVAAAAERLRREQYAPLMPSVLLGVSQGWNGGGVGGNLENFGDRFDGDAVAWWEIRNLGLGEQAAREAARSQVAQARAQELRMMDQVASEVVQAHVQVTQRQTQIEIARDGIASASDSFRRNAERIRNGQGLPIESLQSVQALAVAQRQYARTIGDYNRAQFAFTRALGWPIVAGD